MRVVVFHQGALGDFLLTLPVLEGMRESRPGLRIDFWTKPHHAALLDGKSYRGECHPLDGPTIPSLLHEDLWETVPIPDFLQNADQVLIFGQEGSRRLVERLALRIEAEVRWVRSFPAGSERMHVTDFLSAQMQRIGWPIANGACRLVPPARELAAGRELLASLGLASPPVLVHPGSGGRRKVWPLAGWHGLLHWLSEKRSLPTLLSLGPADEALEGFALAMQNAGTALVRGLSLVRLAALLANCRLYVGSDSGVSHLAAALGVPAIAIFGPTDPAVWAPRGPRVRLVKRRWEESRVMDWEPSRIPGPADPEITEIVSAWLGRSP